MRAIAQGMRIEVYPGNLSTFGDEERTRLKLNNGYDDD